MRWKLGIYDYVPIGLWCGYFGFIFEYEKAHISTELLQEIPWKSVYILCCVFCIVRKLIRRCSPLYISSVIRIKKAPPFSSPRILYLFVATNSHANSNVDKTIISAIPCMRKMNDKWALFHKLGKYIVYTTRHSPVAAFQFVGPNVQHVFDRKLIKFKCGKLCAPYYVVGCLWHHIARTSMFARREEKRKYEEKLSSAINLIGNYTRYLFFNTTNERLKIAKYI